MEDAAALVSGNSPIICVTSPYVNIWGSFFPIWLFCILAGIVITILVRYFFIRHGLDTEIGPPLVIYPCLTALSSGIIWLVLIRA